MSTNAQIGSTMISDQVVVMLMCSTILSESMLGLNT